MATEVKVPVLPESVSDATIASWHKKAGEAVKRDENLVDLETDKVVLEVPSPVDGVLKEIKFETGATVTSSQILAIIEEGAAAAAGAGRLKLDTSKLPAYNAFSVNDLDASKNACDDFNGYVNGKWLAANEIPKDRSSWGAFSILDERSVAVQHQLAEQAASAANPQGVEKIVGDFWSSGMDEAKINAQGIEPLKADLAAIDGLKDGPAIAEYLRQSAAKGENGLFGFGAEADFKNSTMNMAYAMQGGLGLPDRSYYVDADKQDKLKAYQAHVAKVLELAGVPAADAAKQAQDVVALETRLAKVSKSSEQLSRDAELAYNPVTPAEADKLTPNFPWTKFFESQGVAVPEKFSLAIPAFHQEVSKALGDTDPSVWRAYLRFHTVDSASPYLSDAFAQENFAFYGKELNGQAEMKPRWKRVLGSIENGAGEAMGQMYVKVAFSADDKAKMQQLVQNLSQALKARLEKLTWMSDETKAKALEKWKTFTPKIGYPDKWRDYSSLTTKRDSYLDNVRAATAFNYKYNLSKIGKPVDKTEWGMTPQTVNAYYNPLQNEIVFPAAILQPPFFDPKADDAFNYGGIGAVIGHEMTHGYDDQGARFGAHRQLRELVDAGRRQEVLRAHRQAGAAVRRLRSRRQARQRQADPGREHRRPGRHHHRLRRHEEGHRGQGRAEGRRHDPRPELLHQLGHRVAHQVHPAERDGAPDHRPARPGAVPRDRRAVEPGGLRHRVPVQAGRADGAQRRQARGDLVSDGAAARLAKRPGMSGPFRCVAAGHRQRRRCRPPCPATGTRGRRRRSLNPVGRWTRVIATVAHRGLLNSADFNPDRMRSRCPMPVRLPSPSPSA